MQIIQYVQASHAAPYRAGAQKPKAAQKLTDIVHRLAAASLLLVLAPLMMVVMWCIWRTDGAPIFFGHYRVGRGGQLFRCLKFRTMRVDAEDVLQRVLESDPALKLQWDRDQKLASDPRITPIGQFLRKTSLDEFPQLLNVLAGDMRLVGPRPVTPAELMRYDGIRWHYLAVPPGITGLWQVSGRNELSYAQRVALDREYVQTASLWLDLKILLRTAVVVVTGHGAG